MFLRLCTEHFRVSHTNVTTRLHRSAFVLFQWIGFGAGALSLGWVALAADGAEQSTQTKSNGANTPSAPRIVASSCASPEAARRPTTLTEWLPGMMPSAGHLEHMPAHIMQRVGRYEDAAEANRKGAAADDLAYLAKTKPLDYYATMYTAHNYQLHGSSKALFWMW